jgi:hypothetical protein
MLTPSLFVLVEDSCRRSSATTTARRRLWKTSQFLGELLGSGALEDALDDY